MRMIEKTGVTNDWMSSSRGCFVCHSPITVYLRKSIGQVLILVTLILVTLLISCKSDEDASIETDYPRHVGDIAHNSLTDDPDFIICNGDDNVFQYFNVARGPVYFGEKPTLLRTFENRYEPVIGKDQNGLIRIRFIVNCEGHAGRFRLLQSDTNFKETEFDEKIVSQLADITQGIEEWVILYRDNKPVDYYYYLIFKIIDGQISEILP